MNFFKALLVLAFVFCKNVNSKENFEFKEKPLTKFARIVGGYRPKNHDLSKYIVSLRYGEDDGIYGRNHICAGSIISLKLILTAAHCVTDLLTYNLRDKDQMHVVAGNIDRLEHSKWEQTFRIKAIIRYEKFDHTTGFGDLALLVLYENIKEDGEHVKRIEISNKEPIPGEICAVVGWGQIVVNGPLSDELVYLNVTLFPSHLCIMFKRISKEVICAGNELRFQKIAARGDSGGPLICDNKLVGVSSFVTTLQTYFSAVYFFRDWIEKNNTNLFEPNFIIWKFLVLRIIILNL